MGMTSAEKQARYRQKHLVDGEQKRIQLVVSLDAALALKRLAQHLGTTQAEVVESLVLAEKNRVTADMSADQHRAFVGE